MIDEGTFNIGNTITYEDVLKVMQGMRDEWPKPLIFYATPFEYQHALLQGWAEELHGRVFTTTKHPYISAHVRMVKVEKIPHASER